MKYVLLLVVMLMFFSPLCWGAAGKDRALYDEALHHEQLFSQKKLEGDLVEAITTYNKLIRDYPHSALADDALYHIAKLRAGPLADRDKARRALETILARYPNGDMAPKAKTMLAALDATEHPVEVSNVGATAPAKPKENRFREPTARFGGRKAVLMGIEPVSVDEGFSLQLRFDRDPLFSTALEEYGKRTKSPPVLFIDLPQAQAAADLPREFHFASPLITGVKIKHRWFQGGLAVRVDLAPGVHSQVRSLDKGIAIRLTPQSAGAKAMASGSTASKTKKIATKKMPLTIVVDAGHGGEDTGAIGKGRVKEKDVVFAIAEKLARELKTKLGADVILTRRHDKPLSLDERDRIATLHHADLFLSIHANASTDRRTAGIQTYYLNNATDKAAARLAKRENQHAGRPLPQVEHILSTMQQNESAEESRRLATSVQHALIRRLKQHYDGIHDLKVRSALFYVLVGAKCPAILVETSFISNPREEHRLKTAAYQTHLAAAITAGVKEYLGTRGKSAETL